ncbi:MAG: adenylate cyclase [Lachnospiraceae bacterium]|nr:adenylate cyclase [Lachnospiraceae bacterium]
MAAYDYRKGKERIEEILDNKLEVVEQNKLPKDDAFTFSNGYYSWVTGIFVDIRDSSTLFADEDKEKVSKIIRSFTSEVIEILRDDDNLREIGIRGDCVYAIYTTPKKDDILELADKTFYINTYMKMLNKLLSERSLPKIWVGIGMSTAQELVVKAGRKDVGINSKVWIGKAVTRASNLSSLGNKNGNSALVYSYCSYNNFIEALEERNEGKNPRDWFTYHSDVTNGVYYTADVVKSDFDKWIADGMKDN